MQQTKKIYLILLPIIALVLLLLPCTAFADVSKQETEIAELAQTRDQVKSAKCIVYQRACIIAIQTEKFTNKTEYDQFRQELENEILEKYNLDKVVISRSPKVMHAICQLEKMSESERQQAIEKFLQQHGDTERPPMIQPR
ncbi:MAG: YhcN/YlaJ family sporulation lipoprotein [Corallococcus sp.]|nr:YhcN/YlaJ family sporulation lipoprotein [Corallococcus sp.]MCM1359233.1 YhcN/YlaJ family sporulation lipoprotein [Corallococcus sp.]MCM1394624.1 YhcN/YlaJ family sporulation lipoprotein [Corallococcus sp.]